MIYFLIISAVVAVVTLAVCLGIKFNNKRYASFVLEYSIGLRILKEINALFTFYPNVNFDKSHTYDNENFFNTISCEDYLIYELQYQSKEVVADIKKVNYNRAEYQKYIDRIKKVPLGKFGAPTGTLKRQKLEKVEKKYLHNMKIEKPVTQFSITILLLCSKINGYVYDSKQDTFYEEDILNLIKRLNNRSGNYYRDREIWEAICRVERGKVSNKLRFAIYARDGYKCCRCGVSQYNATLEIDHIIPISKGGKSTPDNLQTLCHKCNVEKGSD